VFSSPNLLQLANKIIRGEPDSTIPSHYSRPLMEIIKRCLSKRPADRPTARELLRSQFFLTAMQKFIKLNGIVSEKEQKNIPIKKYKVHKGKEVKKEGKEIRDPRERDGGKSTGNISKKKVEPLAVEVKKERNGSRELKREDSKKGIKSPVI
jgi:serine/threonine protein kinase